MSTFLQHKFMQHTKKGTKSQTFRELRKILNASLYEAFSFLRHSK